MTSVGYDIFYKLPPSNISFTLVNSKCCRGTEIFANLGSKYLILFRIQEVSKRRTNLKRKPPPLTIFLYPTTPEGELILNNVHP